MTLGALFRSFNVKRMKCSNVEVCVLEEWTNSALPRFGGTGMLDPMCSTFSIAEY